MQNRSELVTRSGLPLTARREVVPRAISSVSQTRVWNLLIDVVAQSWRYPPGETDPKKFIVEGEQHYWVHVAIDRFTGQVIDQQLSAGTNKLAIELFSYQLFGRFARYLLFSYYKQLGARS